MLQDAFSGLDQSPAFVFIANRASIGLIARFASRHEAGARIAQGDRMLKKFHVLRSRPKPERTHPLTPFTVQREFLPLPDGDLAITVSGKDLRVSEAGEGIIHAIAKAYAYERQQ